MLQVKIQRGPLLFVGIKYPKGMKDEGLKARVMGIWKASRARTSSVQVSCFDLDEVYSFAGVRLLATDKALWDRFTGAVLKEDNRTLVWSKR